MHFDQTSLLLLSVSALLVVVSIVLFLAKKQKWAVGVLLLGALGLRIFMAQLDPFLNNWDERFHALVAKNMLQQPFIPMLYSNPVLPYNYQLWDLNHIWLHKQPFFLWQIALFFKLFGVSEFTLRLPGVLMMTAQVWLVYRMGRITLNAEAGYLAAFLAALGHYGLELTSGVKSMDHNDMAFTFLVTASIWCWTEYMYSQKRRWLAFIGLFSGLAVLTKWLTGLLVYSGWGITILLDKKRKTSWRPYLNLGLCLLITIAVFLPWQLYISQAFPVESAYEYQYNTRHFYAVVEGHGGSWLYHFEQLENLYQPVFAWALLLALPAFWLLLNRRVFRIGYFTFIVIIYLFFTLAQTKLPGYTYIVSGLIFMALGSLLWYLLKTVQKYLPALPAAIISFVGLLLIGFWAMQPEQIEKAHTLEHDENQYGVPNYRINKLKSGEYFRQINQQLQNPDRSTVLFNTKHLYPKEMEGHTKHLPIELMFYSDVTAYNLLPTEEEYKMLREKGIGMAVIDDGALPDYLQSDASVQKLHIIIK